LLEVIGEQEFFLLRDGLRWNGGKRRPIGEEKDRGEKAEVHADGKTDAAPPVNLSTQATPIADETRSPFRHLDFGSPKGFKRAAQAIPPQFLQSIVRTDPARVLGSIIQAGIKRVVALNPQSVAPDSDWRETGIYAHEMFTEADIEVDFYVIEDSDSKT
jgi:hypothetical protein